MRRQARRGLWAAAAVLAGCVGGGGAGMSGGGREVAGRPGGGDAHVAVACVLVPDGALCSFTAASRPGARCVRVLFGATSGTVVASDDVCSGALAAGESTTRAVRFATRPGDACGPVLGQCESRAVAPADAEAEATRWHDELQQHFSGPVSEADCKKVNEHKYEIYVHADCDGLPDPMQREACVKNVQEEREREMPFLVKDCLQAYKRPRLDCELQAKDQNALYACENQFP